MFFDSWLIAKRRRGKKGIQCFLVYFMCLLLCYFVETQASVYKKSGDLCDGLTLGCISVHDDVDDHSVYV